ncbi:hypothetical protein MJG53_008765 [Ovis ammon polii x Ovis aries]|uniref:Uncharacterized protein n=1 Tax=Ovis ammon polii x Ovis aries TaxID=2918886 RepID=A0ACB9UX01_9CETA|nr:hypothetical protein MJG53_008765 [Ovis ammon polii x Ovis aries]
MGIRTPPRSPAALRKRAGSGSLPGAVGQGAPPARVGRMLACGLVGAVVLVLVGCPLGLHRHDEGLALGQVGPALWHVGLCPIQHYSYGMIWKEYTHTKS